MALLGIMSQPGSMSRCDLATGNKGLMTDIIQFLIGHGGPVLFAVVFAEQAGLPLPSAPWLLAAGALSVDGKLSPVLGRFSFPQST